MTISISILISITKWLLIWKKFNPIVGIRAIVLRQIDSKSSDIIFEMSGSMDKQPFFDGQTVIGKTEDSGASDYSSDRNDSEDRSARNDRNDSNDSIAGAADRDSWPLWLLDSFDGLTEDEQQPPEKVSPHEVLSKMREFCRKFFKTKADDKTKIEWARQFNRYLATITPRLCDRINAEVLDSEPNVVNVSSPSVVFGDIHGNLQDLYDYEQKYWANNDNGIKNYLFLGDFVDRGAFSLEVSIYLFCLKLTDSSKYILVRGNHEVRPPAYGISA